MIKIIEPRVELITSINYEEIIGLIERCGRTCYKSEDMITKGSAEQFVKMLIKRGHESVLEHVSITVKFIGDRTMSHQLVRHRIGSYSQESQRYCNYNKKGELEVVCPPDIKRAPVFDRWYEHVFNSYITYKELIKSGIEPEDARSVLPGCCKTEVATTYNIRQWRHFFKVRTDKHAQWQIRALVTALLKVFKVRMPVLFDDLIYDRESDLLVEWEKVDGKVSH